MRVHSGWPILLLTAALAIGAHASPHHDAPGPSVIDDATRTVESVLPGTWKIEEVRRGTVPASWHGDSTCVLIRLEDASVSFFHETRGFSYHPFIKLWLLPRDWEGRMDAQSLGKDAIGAVYLGENDSFRVLHRSLGRNTWPEGTETIADALDLSAYPLSGTPLHTLDVPAMGRLLRRLGASSTIDPALWQRHVYGIEELPEILYLEVLTWDDPEPGAEPWSLGPLAENATRFLLREALAAFPEKRGVYLRRVTERRFSDLLAVNPLSEHTVP
ncbi:MAG: hypothetical protein QF819_04910 [Gemmatimonadota bacterium]|jgi:hypothetical protein|nr:hypothetical protein [Gemmatimonadota bacterium]MDP7030943.1 hypothetical protein [Gemmatimonadota bacterium]